MGQHQSLILGLLGLVPLILLISASFIVPPDNEIYELLIFIYISYAAVISSFLGGIQWGLITASIERAYSVFLPLFISTVPCLIAWSALLTLENLTISLILIITSFIVAILHDYYLHQQKLTPYWFLSLRIPLSLAVIILTSILFIF
tara:strand:+ start:406 stop:846 length:441 start_codon:yes stop_codon:yes gene_type:complete